MAARAQMLTDDNVSADCARIVAPTLIVTGEPGLDHVVSVDASSEYASLIRGARRVILAGTGHIGSNTKPDVFADVVRQFVSEHGHAAA
jgi:pimeloyl-ACP methyl ester carboxylesterase